MQLLKEKIKESGIPVTEIAHRTGILRETIYNRLKDGGDFKVSEIIALSDVLKLNKKDRDSIFFTS